MSDKLKLLIGVLVTVAVGIAAVLVIYISVTPKDTGLKVSKDTPYVEDFMYKKAEYPDSLAEKDGMLYDESGARFVPESEDEYRTWYAQAGDNHIDAPYGEEILCANWLCRQLSKSVDDITWLSWKQPAEDEDYCHTIVIKFGEEEHIVVWNSETNVFTLLQ